MLPARSLLIGLFVTVLASPVASTGAWWTWGSSSKEASAKVNDFQLASSSNDAEDSTDVRLGMDGEDSSVEVLARRLGEFADNDDYLGAFMSSQQRSREQRQILLAATSRR
mmetsp:Transcript_10904/g.25633  ORF Transcript_10904/g.25633 Transcript_10904/m.25633 type:complete len:111 (-) Transcript_10904:165-497(-)